MDSSVQAGGLFASSWLLIAIPLASALLLLLAGRRSNAWGHLVSTAAVAASFVLGLILFVQLLGRDPSSRAVEVEVYRWIASGEWNVNVGLLIDQLSIVFVLLITGVGTLIHLYSIGYMAADPDRRKFFAFLNLFIAAMLLLVLADNYLVLFVGWEGVGLASYLLIGFWQVKPSAAAAAKKAFVINRVGDMGMVVAIFAMLYLFGSASFSEVNAGAEQLTPFWAGLIGLCLLLAACGKSAQVPLQAWLLDAMEGPTPVSALIHAATMVTAGVYLVVRSHAIFETSELASAAVVIVGTVTLLAGAWIGCAKDDIKKVLAGSTMSQIGYMMVAAGLGPAGYAYAIFHLLTHGFFKANMFLGAGSVMHAMDDDVNMRRYGALARYLPVTAVTFGIGYLAIIGFPFLSGYYSKDHIIEAAFERNLLVGILTLLGAGVTAFYMTRLMLMTFAGQKRWRDGVHPHESPLVMTIPLIILAALSAVSGLVMNNWIGAWLDPAIGQEIHPTHYPIFVVSPVGLLTLVTVAAGVLIGWLVFGRGRAIATEPPQRPNPIAAAGANDLYGDALNDALVVQPQAEISKALVAIDDRAIDRAFTGVGETVTGFGSGLRRLQNGYVRSYALAMIVGGLVIAVVLIVGRLA